MSRLVSVLGALCLLAGCTGAAPPRRQPPNVLLIVIDTLRADRMGFYGDQRGLTSFLDSLAARGTVFWRTYAQSSWTLPSVASLWTSRYQSQHRITVFGSVLDSRERTLAEILKKNGYATGLFSANDLLTNPGFDQGFDVFETFRAKTPWDKEPGEHLNARALRWVDRVAPKGSARAPVFLYLQYMEPHSPYFAPEDAVERVLGSQADAEQERRAYRDMLFTHRERWSRPDPEALRLIRHLYDAEVLSVDAALRDLFAELQKRGFLQNAVVVITADHGEEIMDHGAIGHGSTLYEEVIHIPLLILAPGQSVRTDVRQIVSEIDIAPTVLDLAGIGTPSCFEGHSLKADIAQGARRSPQPLAAAAGHQGRTEGDQIAYSELLKFSFPNKTDRAGQVRAVIVGSQKLCAYSPERYESYDLDADPHEHNPHGLTASQQLALEQDLQSMERRASSNTSPTEVRTPDAATRERMHALGYLQ